MDPTKLTAVQLTSALRENADAYCDGKVSYTTFQERQDLLWRAIETSNRKRQTVLQALLVLA